MWATMLGLLLLSFYNFVSTDFLLSPILLLLSTAIIYFLSLQVKRGRDKLASELFLYVLAVMITLLAINGSGLRDPAMLGFAGLLIYAAMLGSKRTFIFLLIYIFLSIFALGLAVKMGLIDERLSHGGWGIVLDFVVILSIISYAIWLLVGDLRGAMSQLKVENELVKQGQAQIQHMANHDLLTGLVNRSIARDRFAHCHEHTQRREQRIALLFLDLDNFKQINDSLGHNIGDQILVETARRLNQIIRRSDTICRYGGDEFVIIIEDIDQIEVVTRIAYSVLDGLSESMQIDDKNLSLSCSLGIAVAPDDGDDFDTLLKKSDIAMYAAKEAGRNTFRYYNDNMNADNAESLTLLSNMRLALSNNEFELHYQPQFALGNETLIGAEALIRWRHPELGLIPPFKFIPLAEKSGLIVEIGQWVLQQACKDCKKWVDMGFKEFVVAVNLSSVQFRRGNIEHIVIDALQAAHLSGVNLELELTESLLIDDSDSFQLLLGRLKALGLKFSIDDFGTGYSNLGYLKKFQVETLKVDQSFIRNMMTDEQDRAIVMAILQMARSLGLKTVAEGIEDEASRCKLIELECDYGQGYYWSPAINFEEFTAKYIAAHTKHLH